MARTKQSVVQRDFTRMQVREDLLEADDIEVRSASLRVARNMKSLASRTIEARPGLFYVRDLSDAEEIYEIRPTSSLLYGVVLKNNALEVIDLFGRVVFSVTSVPWNSAKNLWLETFRENTLIGGDGVPIQKLIYSSGNWGFEPFEFTKSAGNEVAQPYWAFEPTVSILPSSDTGTITVTASKPIWTNDYVGLRIRYNRREILITERLSDTVVRGNVISRLPPSFDVTLSNASDFRVGEAVVGADTNYQGVVVGISGSTLQIVTLKFFSGPDVGEKLSSPNATSNVTAKTKVSPYGSGVWDEQLISPVRGYPRAAGSVAGRLVFLDFPLVPDLVACSSTREIEDFEAGADDDDAIVRQIGDNAPRFLHAVNSGDLLLLSDRGCYFIPSRESGVITPTSFNSVLFDKRGASEVKPVQVDDGVVFVEASGENISAALLDGNRYLKWSVRSLTVLYNEQIKSPKKLCGPSLSSTSEEKYLFVVNDDGTLAAVSWQTSLAQETVGFAPWDTTGKFVNVAPMFGGYWTIVDRETSQGTRRYLERFSDDAYLDCSVETAARSSPSNLIVNGDELDVNGSPLVIQTAVLGHIPGAKVRFYANGYTSEEYLVNDNGTVTDEPAITGTRQIGLNFTASASPWPVELVESPRIGMLKARVVRFGVSVQKTSTFQVRCNKSLRTIEGYRVGDDLTVSPEFRTKVYRFPVMGRKDHPEMEVIKHLPGPFRLLSMTQEVQA